MSRRYGRNQKRRAREALAQASEALAMATGLQRYTSERLAEAREEIQQAKEMLPDGSVLFEPAAYPGSGFYPGQRNVMPEYGGFDSLELSASMPATASYSVMPLHHLITLIGEDRFRNQVYFQAEFADGVWRYAITEQALKSMTAERLESVICKALARQFAQQLKEKGMLR